MTNELIARRLKILADLQEELNKAKTHYTETLESDSQFQEVEDAVVKVKNEAKEKREKILEKPAYKNISDQIKEIQRDIKENREVLSQELVDYYRTEGVTEVEDHEGNVKRMKFSVRLVNG